MPALLLRMLRDALLLAATYALWHASRGPGGGAAALSVAIAVAAGLMIPFAAFVVHEWGHLIGAWLSGSSFDVSSSARTVLLFRFDENRNSRRQCLAMTGGGFVASGLTVVLLLATLSFHRLADAIALCLTAAGVVATFVLEVPPAWKTFKSPDRSA